MKRRKCPAAPRQRLPDALKLVSGGVGEGAKKEFVQLPLFQSDIGIHPVEYALQEIIEQREKLIAKWVKAEKLQHEKAMETYEQTIGIFEQAYYFIVTKYTKKLKPKKYGLKLVKAW